MIRRRMGRNMLLALLFLSACYAGAQGNDDKARKICSVTGGLDMTRLVSSRARNLFRSALEDVEFVREYLSESAINGGTATGFNTLEALNNSLDWEARNLTSSDTTLSAGLGYIDDRRERRIEKYVSTVNEPFVGTKQTDLAFVDPVSNIFPWLVDRRSTQEKWALPHLNGETHLTKEGFDKLYVAAWIGSFGEAWMYYPPLPFSFGDFLGPEYDSHEEEFVKPNLPENNPERKATITSPYPDTAVPGLSLITAKAPVYFTGEFMGFEYNDTYVASTGVDISVESLSSLLAELEGTLSAGSFAFLVAAETFDMVVISQATVEKIYPERTGSEEARVTYSYDGSITSDRRNQTYLVSDTIFQSPKDLENAEWEQVGSLLQKAVPGSRGSTLLNVTLTGSEEPASFHVMYERWRDVAEFGLVVLAPQDEVDNAISIQANEKEITLDIAENSILYQTTQLRNIGTLDVLVRVEKFPPWYNLMNVSSSNEFLLPAKQAISFTYKATSERVTGQATGIIAFTVQDHNYPDCFHEHVLTIPVNMTVIKEPELNQLNRIRPYGFVLTAIITVTALGCSFWTTRNGHHRVVRASQPLFLHTMCWGILMMGLSIIPLSIDDSIADQRGCNIACMATPWLLAMGFSMTFSALFSKILRINQILGARKVYRKVRVSTSQVMIPFVIMCSLNVTVLALWTALEPMEWIREPLDGSKFETTGGCRLEDGSTGVLCLIALLLLNFIALVLALIQLYKAREVSTEYSEGKYIAIAVGSMVQVFLTGLPILIIITENPQASYLVLTTIIFVVTMSLLLLTFVPKFVMTSNEKCSLDSGSGAFAKSVSHQKSLRPARCSTNSGIPKRHDVLQQDCPLAPGEEDDDEVRMDGGDVQEIYSTMQSRLPIISELSVSLASINELQEEDFSDHGTGSGPSRDALRASDSVSEQNAKFPSRKGSTRNVTTFSIETSSESAASANARIPIRLESIVEPIDGSQSGSLAYDEESGMLSLGTRDASSVNAKFPLRMESIVEPQEDISADGVSRGSDSENANFPQRQESMIEPIEVADSSDSANGDSNREDTNLSSCAKSVMTEPLEHSFESLDNSNGPKGDQRPCSKSFAPLDTSQESLGAWQDQAVDEFTLRREPSKRTVNHFSNASIPLRFPSTVED